MWAVASQAQCKRSKCLLEEALHSLEYTQAPVPDTTNTNMHEADNKPHVLMCENTTQPIFKGQQLEKALFALRLGFKNHSSFV